MRDVLHLKCQSDLVITSQWKKETNTKTHLVLLIQKFNRNYTLQLFSVREKRRMKTESTALARRREIKCHEVRERERERKGERERERVEGRHRPWIIFHISIEALTMLVRWFRLLSLMSDVRPFFGAHPKMVATTYGCLYIVASSRQITLFQFSIPCPLLTASVFESPSSNQN